MAFCDPLASNLVSTQALSSAMQIELFKHQMRTLSVTIAALSCSKSQLTGSSRMYCYRIATHLSCHRSQRRDCKQRHMPAIDTYGILFLLNFMIDSNGGGNHELHGFSALSFTTEPAWQPSRLSILRITKLSWLSHYRWPVKTSVDGFSSN